MSWSHGTHSVGGLSINGWLLSVDGRTQFVDPGYFAAFQDTRNNAPPGHPWRSNAVWPDLHFGTFFYNDANADLEAVDGLALIAAAEAAAATYTIPDAQGIHRTCSRLISGFRVQDFIGDSGLYVYYSYIFMDSASGSGGGTPPGFAPASPSGPGPIGGSGGGRPGPPPAGGPPNPPTKPPGVMVPAAGAIPELTVEVPPDVPVEDVLGDFPDGDIIEIPIDDGSDTGQLVEWQPVYPSGIDRPNAIFGWDTPPRNLSALDSLDDGQQTVNEIYAVGGADAITGLPLTVTVQDAASIAAIGRYWGTENFSFATSMSTLIAMANARLRKYRHGAHVVTFDPAAGSPSLPVPWAEFDVSDTVRVRASWKLRGGFDPTITTIFGHTLDVQRVNGWDLELDDDTDAEKLTRLYTEEDLG